MWMSGLCSLEPGPTFWNCIKWEKCHPKNEPLPCARKPLLIHFLLPQSSEEGDNREKHLNIVHIQEAQWQGRRERGQERTKTDSVPSKLTQLLQKGGFSANLLDHFALKMKKEEQPEERIGVGCEIGLPFTCIEEYVLLCNWSFLLHSS